MKLKDVSIIWIPWILNSVLLCSPQEYEIARQARNLHFSSLILDTHVDTTPKLLTEWKFTEEHHAGHVDLPRMLKGGLNALFFSIWIPGETRGPQAVNDALIRIAAVHKLAEDSPDKISLCVTADQVRQARRQGKIAALIGMEGGHMLNNNLSILRMYSLLGVRYLTLTHSVNADWADSSGDKAAHNGLTPLGKEIIQELNREGIIVDISHSSDKTFWDALEVSKAPLIASHSSCRALCSHPRNMTGNMIKALAAKGGVIQINYHVEFLDDRAAEYFKKAEPVMRELAAEYVQKGKLEDLRQEITRRFGPPPSISWERIVDHIDHAVKLVGAAHVGLGSDFDGAQMPEGMEDVSQLPKITEGLVRKGYPSAEIKMILGENLLRVLTDVERAARTMRGH